MNKFWPKLIYLISVAFLLGGTAILLKKTLPANYASASNQNTTRKLLAYNVAYNIDRATDYGFGNSENVDNASTETQVSNLDNAIEKLSTPTSLVAKDTAGVYDVKSGGKEIISERTATFKTFDDGDRTKRVAGQIGDIHYKTDPFSTTEQYKEIDLTLLANTGKINNDYDYYLNQNGYQLQIWNQQKIDNNDLNYIAKFTRADEDISMAPLTLAWENSAGEYQEIAKPISGITPEIDNTNYTVTWKNAFGNGLDFRYNISPDKFFKTVIVNAKSDLPPATIGQDGLKLTIVMSTAWSNVEANNNFAKDNKNKELATGYKPSDKVDETKTDPGQFSYKDSENRDLWWMQKPLAWDSSEQPNIFDMTYNLEKVGDNNFMKLSASDADMEKPTTKFPFFIDTTISDKQVGASTDDATDYNTTWPGAGNTSLVSASNYVGASTTNFYSDGSRFTSIPIPQGSTINYADVRLYGLGATQLDITVYADAHDNAATFAATTNTATGSPGYRTLSTASTQWNAGTTTWGAGALLWNYSPNIAPVVSEVVQRAGWSSSNALAIIINNTSHSLPGADNSRYHYMWDYSGNAYGNKFTATYSNTDKQVSISNSSTATQNSTQRKTWYDGTRYWQALVNNSTLEFWYSTDGVNWIKNPSATLADQTYTNDFSIEADSSYAFISYDYASNGSLYTRSASSYPGTGFGWSGETSVGTGTLSTLARDSAGKVRATYYRNSASLHGDTLVDTPQGKKELKDLRIGDKVISYDEKLKMRYPDKVTDWQEHTVGEYLVIKSEKSVVKSSFDHMFYLATGEQLNADQLRVGMDLLHSDGARLTADKILSIQTVKAETKVYDITVKSNHNFFANGELVHNFAAPPAYYCNIKTKLSTSANNITAWGSEETLKSDVYGGINDPCQGITQSIGSSNMYGVYTNYPTTNANKGKKYTNGSGWGSVEAVDNIPAYNSNKLMSMLKDSADNLHLVYVASDGTIAYRKYTTSAGTWSSATTLEAGTTGTNPVITVDSNSNLAAFWIVSNTIYYKKYSAGVWDSSATSLYSTGTNTGLSAGVNSNSNTVFVSWTNGTGAPYGVMWDKVTIPNGNTISGTVYTQEDKGANIGASKTIGLSINGGAKTTVETTAGGAFSFGGVTVAASDTVTIFEDDESSEESTYVTQASGATNITGLELFTSKVVLSHVTAGPMSNTLLATADNCTDDDIKYTISGSDVTFNSAFETYILTGKTYTPGGAVTAGDFELVGTATFSGSTNAFSTSGSLVIASGATWTHTGALSFDAASGTKTINAQGKSFGNTTINATGAATWSIASALDINGTFTMSGGSLDLDTSDPTVNISGNVSITAGTITKSSTNALVTLDGDLSYTNSAGTNLGDLYIGHSPDTTTLASNLTCDSLVIDASDSLITAGYNITDAGSLTIGTSATLDATTSGGRNSAISVGGNWANSGTFTASTSTVTLNGTVAQAISGSSTTAFNILTISNTSAAVSASTNFSVAGDLTINASAVLTPAAAVIISGSGTLTGSGTAQVSRTAATADFSSQYTITNKTYTNLTVEYTAAAAQTVSAVAYGNLKISTTSSAVATVAGDLSVSGVLTISSGGTFDASSRTITLSGSGTPFVKTGTFTASTSTIALTYTGASATSFVGSTSTYNNITVAPGSGVLTFSGTFTFANMTMASAGTKPVKFTKSTTYTMTGTSFLSGTSGNLVTISSDTAANAFTLSKTAGTVTVDFVSLQDSTATGGATWNAKHSTSVSGNTGWNFLRSAVAAGGNWSATTTWWDGVVPTASSDVYLDNISGSVAVDVATANLKSFDMTGYANTLSGASAINIIGAASSTVTVKFAGTISWTGTLNLNPTAADTDIQLTAGGKSLTAITINGNNAGDVMFMDAVTLTAACTLTNGHLHADGDSDDHANAHSWLNFTTATGTKTFVGGNSTITLTKASGTAWSWSTTNATLTEGTSTIVCNGSGATFAGGGETYATVTFNTGAGTRTITGNNSFGTLNFAGSAVTTDALSLPVSGTTTVTGTLNIDGNNSTNRVLVYSSTLGTATTLTVTGATISGCSNVNFRDIAFVSTGAVDLSAITGLSGDALGNSISGGGTLTFTTSRACNFKNVAGGSWADDPATTWDTAVDADRVPLPQDDVTFATVFNSGVTVTANMPVLGRTIDWSGASASGAGVLPIFTLSNNTTIYGGLNLQNIKAGTGISGSLKNIYFEGRTSYDFHFDGHGFSNHSAIIQMVNGTFNVLDAIPTHNGSISLSNGTFTTDYNVTTNRFTTASGTALNMGSGTWTLPSSSSNYWTVNDNCTLNAGSSTILLTNGNNATFIAGASKTYNNISINPGDHIVTFSGAFTFANMTMASAGTKTVKFTKSTTYTMTGTNFLSGSGTGDVTLDTEDGAGTFTLDSDGGVISCDYLDISRSTATPATTWYAGINSHDTTTNSGWIFTAPPVLITISGSANGNDGATVKIAVDAVEQTGKTAVIGSSAWSITGVTQPTNGQIITVWVDAAAAANETTCVGKYNGASPVSGMVLNTNVLSIGSSEDQSLTVTDMSHWTNTDNEDVMHTVTGTGTILNVDGGSSYATEKIDILGGDTLTIGTAETLNTHHLLITGTLTSSGNSTYNVAGDWTNGGTFTASTSTVTLSGSATQVIGGASTTAFNALTISNTGAAISATTNFSAGGNVTINASAVLTPAAAVIISGSGTLTGSGTAQVSRTAATPDFSSQYTITNKTLTNLTVEYTAAAAQTVSNVAYGHLKISTTSSAVATLAGATTVNGNLTISSGGTLNTGASNYNMNVASDWTNSGTFTSGTGTLTLNGQGLQTITSGGTDASHDYYNLEITNPDSTNGVTFADSATVTGTFTDVTASSKLTFHALSAYAFAAININGQATGTKITMVSSDPANVSLPARQWYLNISGASPQATFVNVTDSDALGGNAITPITSTDGGNNENWLFNTAPVNDSLDFTNHLPATNIAVADNTTEWNFEAKVTDADGLTDLNYVMLRMANSSDSTTPYDSLRLKWVRSTNAFTLDNDSQSAVTLGTGSSSSSGNQWTINFKLKFNDSAPGFSTKDTSYAAELYSIDNATASDLDNYADIYKVTALSLTLDITFGATVVFGDLTPGTPIKAPAAATVASVTTNALNGYTLGLHDGVASPNSSMLHTDLSTRIAKYAGTIATPTSWTGYGVGITCFAGDHKDTSQWGTGTTYDHANNKYAGIPEAATTAYTATGYTAGADTSSWAFEINGSNSQKTGDYSGIVTFTATEKLN